MSDSAEQPSMDIGEDMLMQPPEGMPRQLAETYGDMHDILYLAACDSAYSSVPIGRLVEMLTVHVGLGQALVHRVNGWPIFFVLWAKMTDPAIRKLMEGGYNALAPSDLRGGEKTVLVGICSPWQQEDFDTALGWASLNLASVAPTGTWHMVLPPADGIPARLTRFVQVDDSHGRFEEARL